MGDLALGKAGMPPDISGIPTLAELYFERRKLTHRAGAEDNSRWKNHIAPFFAQLKPDAVDAGRILDFIEAKRVRQSV